MTDLEQRLARAYADERFALPSAALTGLVRRRRRRRGYVMAAVAVLAAAGIAVGVDRLRAQPEPAVTGEFGVTAAAATCFQHAGTGAPPAAAFTFTDADAAGYELVVTAGDQRAVACTQDEASALRPGDREPAQAWLAGGELDFAYGGGAGLGLVVIGTTPPGTERVEVLLPDGTEVPAHVQGGWFAAWQPPAAGGGGPNLGVRIVAHTGTGDDTEEVVIR